MNSKVINKSFFMYNGILKSWKKTTLKSQAAAG